MVHPNSPRPCANAATRPGASGSSAVRFMSTPTRRMRSGCCARRERPRHPSAAEQRDELATLHLDHLVSSQSFWQATKHEHNAGPVGDAQANAPEVFSVEPEDFPAAKHVCESSVDRKSKCPISSRQHYCKGLERKVVREQHKVPQTFSPR